MPFHTLSTLQSIPLSRSAQSSSSSEDIHASTGIRNNNIDSYYQNQDRVRNKYHIQSQNRTQNSNMDRVNKGGGDKESSNGSDSTERTNTETTASSSASRYGNGNANGNGNGNGNTNTKSGLESKGWEMRRQGGDKSERRGDGRVLGGGGEISGIDREVFRRKAGDAAEARAKAAALGRKGKIGKLGRSLLREKREGKQCRAAGLGGR